MARKHLLEGLTDAKLTAVNSGSTGPLPAMPPGAGARGAIGAVSRSIEQIKAQGVIDLDPELIEPSGIRDRLTGESTQHEELVASIRDHGQQVPILVRPHPDGAGRYQIAYGRRRLRAIAALGRKVRAIVKPLTDRELVVAQGQENSARTDLSFIEKALFAARLEEGGFDRETIMAALTVDKTTLSRLISSAIKIPSPLIEAIGPAPRAGRDRWIELANRLAASGAVAQAEKLVTTAGFADKPSDDRFNAVFAAVSIRPPRLAKPRLIKAADGSPVARVREDEFTLQLAIDKKQAGAFAGYLLAALPEIHAAFKRGGGPNPKPQRERSDHDPADH